MVAVPERGSLGDTPFPQLLLDLFRAEFSGQLRLTRDRVEKTLLLDCGVPVFAESNIASESLGAQLAAAGQISDEQQRDLAGRVEHWGCKEGSALLEMQLIEPKGLFVAMKEQVQLRIVECFSWEHGTFEVDPSVQPQDDARPFRTDLYPLIQQGIEQHWRIDRVLSELETKLALFPTRSSKLAVMQRRLCVDEALQNFVDALDGATTLWDALRLANTPRAAAGVWVLDAAEALKYRDAPKQSSTASVTEIELVLNQPSAEPEGAPATSTEKPANATSGALEAEIAAKHDQLDELNHYEMLGVEPNAAVAEIRSAYLQAAKTYHPDALATAEIDSELRERANRVFAAIGKAHSELANPDRRLAYDRRLASDGSEIDADKLANAETLFRKGEILLKQGNFKAALEFLLPAVELWPEEADYQSAAGWALYKKMPSEPDVAREHLDYAMKLSPDDAIVVFRLSLVLRALGDEETASRLLERAQSLDPKVSTAT